MALALAAKGQPGVESSVPVIAYGIVVLSLIFQGSVIRPAVGLLQIEPGAATMTAAQGFLFFLLLLGILAAVLRLFSQRAPVIPYQVILAAAGVILGLIPGLPLPKIGPELLLLAFVPGLVFEAALSLDLQELRKQALAIGLLATAGVFIGTLLLAMTAHYLFGMDWTASAVLAAIVATTDPVAVVSVLRRLRVPTGLTAILEGESLQ